MIFSVGKTVFHLLEDAPFDVMNELARMNPKITESEKIQGALILEETYTLLKKGMNNPDLSVTVKVKKRFGDIFLELTAKGEAINPIFPLTEWVDDEADLFSVSVLKVNKDRLGYARRNGANVVTVRIYDGGKKAIYMTMLGIFLGIFLGLAFKMTLPAEILSLFDNDIISPAETMFMHATFMMVPPVIFFSVVKGITSMSETTDIGKLGKRLIVQSVVMVAIADILSVIMGLLLFPDELTQLADLFEKNRSAASSEGFSFEKLIVGIVPSNLLQPFDGQNTLQVLFIALFFGIVINKLGEKARIAHEIIEFMDSFCIGVMGMLVKLIPAVIFLSMMKLMFHADMTTFLVMGKVILGSTSLSLLLLLLFGIIIGVYGKLSPTIFLKKLFVFAPIPMAIRSSNASLPQAFKFIVEKFGVSPNLASFALPIGTQLHLVGIGPLIALPAIMTARALGAPVNLDFILYLMIYIFIFAYTTPAVPGGVIIAMSSVFGAIGLPPTTVTVFLFVISVCDMDNTLLNVSCNVTSSVLLAKKFNMIDEKIYKSDV